MQAGVNVPQGESRRTARAAIAVAAAIGWSWAVAALSTREHLTAIYTVLSAAPPLWGFLVLDGAALLAIALIGMLLGLLAFGAAERTGQDLAPPTRWLLAAWSVPLADLGRLLGWEIPFTFVEPILLAGITGAAMRGLLVAGSTAMPSARPSALASVRSALAAIGSAFATVLLARAALSSSASPRADVPSLRAVEKIRSAAGAVIRFTAVWGPMLACALWWHNEAQRAYEDFLLGYNDFGHFAWRVVNTWEGRGFLLETPSLPAFWDHFNPGLALLAPLWGIWSDARLFFAIHAVCLALPAPLVFALARRLGTPWTGAWAWAMAWLCYPVVGQFNLNCTYGWHPVVLALPLLFAAMNGLARGRLVAAGAACLIACSFQEDVIAMLASFCLAMALASWREKSNGGGACLRRGTLAARLPWHGWLAAGTLFLAMFAAVFVFAPFSKYQVGRFSRLGATFSEIALSPLLRPGVFWGTVFRPPTFYFLAALFVPLGLRALGRAWSVLLAVVVPLGVLIVWGHSPAVSIAFQYTTVLLPVFFLAAVTGASADGSGNHSVPRVARGASANHSGHGVNSAAIAALAASALASTWFGALPWSRPTLTDVVFQTYPGDGSTVGIENRRAGSIQNRFLQELVARAVGPRSSVLASGRVAAHCLAARRLDTVAQAGERWNDFQREVGAGRSPIELFDFVVIDTSERFYQSPEQSAFIIRHAQQAGYQLLADQFGIIAYQRAAE